MTDVRQLSDYALEQIRLPRDGSPADAVAFFAGQDPARLAVLLVNDQLNRFIGDSRRDEGDAPIDYQGWFWRSVDFFTPRGITIAEGDGRVAICQNNKWGYPERDLTEAEQTQFLTLVWAAYLESRKGGNLAEIYAATDAALGKANDFILSLDVNGER